MTNRMFARQGTGIAGRGRAGISVLGLLVSGVMALGGSPALAQAADSATSVCKTSDAPVKLSYWPWGAG